MLQKAVFYSCMHMCMSRQMDVLTKNNNSSKARLYRRTGLFTAFQGSRCECTGAHSESGMCLAFSSSAKPYFTLNPNIYSILTHFFHPHPLRSFNQRAVKGKLRWESRQRADNAKTKEIITDKLTQKNSLIRNFQSSNILIKSLSM